jgi:hypothetical protein
LAESQDGDSLVDLYTESKMGNLGPSGAGGDVRFYAAVDFIGASATQGKTAPVWLICPSNNGARKYCSKWKCMSLMLSKNDYASLMALSLS